MVVPAIFPWHPVLDSWDRRTLSKKSLLVKNLPPEVRQDLPPMVVSQYDTPLYPRLTNNYFGGEWTRAKMHELLMSECVCNRPEMKKFHHPATRSPEGDIHVLTSDTALVALYSENLATLMGKGAQFRCSLPTPLSEIDFNSSVENMIQQLVARHGEKFDWESQYDLHDGLVESLTIHVRAQTQEEIENLESKYGFKLTSEIRDALKRLQNDFYITVEVVTERNFRKSRKTKSV